MASTPEAVKEMLVTKSVDYAGRPQTYGLYNLSRGMLQTIPATFCVGVFQIKH